MARKTNYKPFLTKLFYGLWALSILWAGGLIWFYSIIPNTPSQYKAETPLPAIIVLTGGALRVEKGIEALQDQLGERLFISGVYQSTDVKMLLSLSQNAENHTLIDKIELGHEAMDTSGNADEIAAWVKENHIEHAMIITGAYHMPRSLMEIKHRLPNLDIIPYPVFPSHVKLDNLWFNLGSLGLVMSEYHKSIGGFIRLYVISLWPNKIVSD